MSHPKSTTNEIYHIYNRGVEKRVTYLNPADYMRFIESLIRFNNVRATQITKSKSNFDNRDCLVNIISFVLMPNHFHLVLQERLDGGIVKFMQKLGTGYTNYFNKKYDRVGPLFQGSYKAVHITDEEHLHYLPFYIHLNPLDLTDPEWRSGSVKNLKKALGSLDDYYWSSYRCYTNQSKFDFDSEVLDLAAIKDFGIDIRTHKRDVVERLTSKSNSIDYRNSEHAP